jgi:hypothetical protein
MCLRRAPEEYIAGAALDRAGLDNVGSSTSHNPTGLHGLLRGFTLLFFTIANFLVAVGERWTKGRGLIPSGGKSFIFEIEEIGLGGGVHPTSSNA